MDWSPSFVDGSTIGGQLQLDRYPVLGTQIQTAVNFKGRKSLLRERLELEAQFFRGLRLNDRFLQVGAIIKPWGTAQLRLLYQSFLTDARSPLGFLETYDRLGAEISLIF